MTPRVLPALLLVGALLVGATSCAAPAAPAPTEAAPATPSAPVAPSATPTPTETPTPTPTCTELTGEEAVDRWIDEVPLPSYVADLAWSRTDLDASTYDPCADLSWIVVTIEGGTASSPYHVMLFHAGEYLGTATKIAYGFFPEVVRIDDASIEATYRFLQDGDPGNAAASGRAVATYTWDGESVEMEGEVPPGGRE